MSNRSDYFFIYPKNTNGHPSGSAICVLLRDGKMYHGEATCSKEDQFNKKVGRDIAYKRALEAADAATNKKEEWTIDSGDGCPNTFEVKRSTDDENNVTTTFIYSENDPLWTFRGMTAFEVYDNGNDGLDITFMDHVFKTNKTIQLSYSNLADIALYFCVNQENEKYKAEFKKSST